VDRVVEVEVEHVVPREVVREVEREVFRDRLVADPQPTAAPPPSRPDGTWATPGSFFVLPPANQKADPPQTFRAKVGKPVFSVQQRQCGQTAAHTFN